MEKVDLSKNLLITGSIDAFSEQSNLNTLILTETGITGVLKRTSRALHHLYLQAMKDVKINSSALSEQLETLSLDATVSIVGGSSKHLLRKNEMKTIRLIGTPGARTLLPSLGESFAVFTKLEHLEIYGIQFQGTLPETISKLRKLTTLCLVQGGLRGTLPGTIKDLNLLYRLNLNGNRLKFKVRQGKPFPIAAPQRLGYFHVQGNAFEGELWPVCRKLCKQGSDYFSIANTNLTCRGC